MCAATPPPVIFVTPPPTKKRRGALDAPMYPSTVVERKATVSG